MTARWPCEALGVPGAPPLIYLHGFLGSRSDWLPVARVFASRYHCIIPDLPGHGENTAPQDVPLTFETLSAGLRDFIEAMQLEKPVLVGYSLGGRAALNFACAYPDLLSGLVLESASPGIPSAASRGERAALDDARAAAILRDGLGPFLEHWYSAGLWASLAKHPEKRDALIRERSMGDPAALAKAVADLSPGRMASLWSQIPHLRLPVLLLAGALDEKYTGVTRRAGALIPQSKTVIVEQAGHNIHLEQPERFVSELNAFLSSIS